jgi:hypothetical protein
VNGETGCVANDLHNAKLQAKVNALNKAGANVVMLDETGPAFGNNPHTPPS